MLFANVFPEWDGAYQSVIHLWRQYEKSGVAPCMVYNQFYLCPYSSVPGVSRSISLARRKDFKGIDRR